MDTYKVIGVMSGSSLDGLDIACCELKHKDGKWRYQIRQAITLPYDEKWIVRLSQLHEQPAHLYPKTDLFYGRYIGIQVKRFLQQYNQQADLIASHGHTIFHQPENGFTAQIGSGAGIYAETGIKTITDFRTVDVMLGGQGAPLVPIGDELLFSDYEACLNLGGIANISYRQDEKRLAFDISPCNSVMNQVAQTLGKAYDDAGQIATSGMVNPALLKQLNALDFYQQHNAKSLGREWITSTFWPLVSAYEIEAADLLATFNKHIATQIASCITHSKAKNVLVTGGGAFNSYLIENIQQQCETTLMIPDSTTVQYKEALIFAFLGVLRLRGEMNVLKEVTGASQNNMGGAIWG